MTSIKPLLLATAVLGVQPVFAQTKAETQTATESAGFSDIVVTARKTEEKLQDVPLTIKALTGQDLQDRGITSVAELSTFTPGLSYSPDFGRTSERPVIRGISALRPEAPQPVSIFVNGVFVRDAALALNLDDAERVEIIKGPQSALYGRSTYAGAINYITNKPRDEWSGKVQSTVAQHDEWSVFGALTVPIIRDVLSTRLRAKHYKYGGEYTNAISGNKIGQEETNSFGAEWRFTPSSSVEWSGSVDWSHDSDGLFAATIRTIPTQVGGVVTNQNGSSNVANGAVCNGRTINIVGNNAAGIPDPAVPASATTRANGWPCGASTFTGTTVRRNEADLANYSDPATGIAYGNIAGLQRSIFRVTSMFNYEFGEGYNFTVQSAYTNQRANVGTDQSYNGTRFAPGNASWLTYDRDRLSYSSHEVRISSPQNQPFTWLAGAFYYLERTQGRTTGVITPTGSEALRQKSASSSRNLAGFARVQYASGDFKISAEGRYGEERVIVGGTPLGVANFTVGTCVAGKVCFINGDRTFRDFSPRVTVDYKVAPNVMVYAQAAKGQKSGGFNTTAGLPNSVFAFDGEKVWSYEVGLKSDLLDRRVRFNVALFQNDIEGLQLSNISTVQNPFNGTSSTTTIVNNVGKARTRGFEVELNLKPIDWLTVTTNYAYTDAKAIEGTETTNGTAFGGNRSVAGFTLPRSPKHSFAESVDISYPINDDLRFIARADLVYQSRRYAEIQNLIWADPFARVNASVGFGGKNWRGIVFVKNLTNDRTSLNGFRYLDPVTFRRTAVDFLPRLRQFGATISFTY